MDFQGFDGGCEQAHRGPPGRLAACGGQIAGIVARGGILRTEQGSGSVPNSATQTGPGAASLRLPLRGRLGLSGKLLLLTIPLVLILEVLIYVPSIANFYVNRLNDRLAAATTAALVLDAAPSGMVPDSLSRQILESIGARAVAISSAACWQSPTCRRR